MKGYGEIAKRALITRERCPGLPENNSQRDYSTGPKRAEGYRQGAGEITKRALEYSRSPALSERTRRWRNSDTADVEPELSV